MNDLSTFTYGVKPVRVIDRDGQPWWVLKDVCDVLELSNARAVADRLDDDEVRKFDLRGQAGEVNIISESGLYSVILRSDKPEARKFRKWVTSEVLPSIRKTGGYIRADAPSAQLPAVVAAAVDAAIKAIGRQGERRQFRLDTPDTYTDAERRKIDRWKMILLEWREFRMFLSDKTAADHAYIKSHNERCPDMQISYGMLHDKWREWRKGNERYLSSNWGPRRKHG
jgi:prophage antirepressor-like protein